MSDGKRSAQIRNGDVMLSRVVGTGCMSNVIVAAFAAVQTDAFTAAVGGLVAFGATGELAAQISGNRPGTFAMEIMNGLLRARFGNDPGPSEGHIGIIGNLIVSQ